MPRWNKCFSRLYVNHRKFTIQERKYVRCARPLFPQNDSIIGLLKSRLPPCILRALCALSRRQADKFHLNVGADGVMAIDWWHENLEAAITNSSICMWRLLRSIDCALKCYNLPYSYAFFFSCNMALVETIALTIFFLNRRFGKCHRIQL